MESGRPHPLVHASRGVCRCCRRGGHLGGTSTSSRRSVFAREAVPDNGSELAAISPLLVRPSADQSLNGTLLSIDAVATNAEVARAVTAQGACRLFTFEADRPTLRAGLGTHTVEAAKGLGMRTADPDESHGGIEERRTAVLRDTGWLCGPHRFPG